MVLCTPGFLTGLAQVEREVAGVTVGDAETAQVAANLIQRLTAAQQALEKARKQLKDPLLEAGRQIDAAALSPANRIAAAKKTVNGKLVNWQTAERKRAEEAERARKEAEEKAKAQPAMYVDFGDEPAPPVVAAPQPTGVRWVTRLLLTVEDAKKLPVEFQVVTANEPLIRAKFCVGYKEGDPVPTLPGVVFKVDQQAISRGGADF